MENSDIESAFIKLTEFIINQTTINKIYLKRIADLENTLAAHIQLQYKENVQP